MTPDSIMLLLLTISCSSRVDVAHLVLYHLSVCCKKKYFDFDREILPFTSENWDSLLLGEVRVLKFENCGFWNKECVLPGTHLPSPFSFQTLPKENALPSSFLPLTATRTGESEEGG